MQLRRGSEQGGERQSWQGSGERLKDTQGECACGRGRKGKDTKGEGILGRLTRGVGLQSKRCGEWGP